MSVLRGVRRVLVVGVLMLAAVVGIAAGVLFLLDRRARESDQVFVFEVPFTAPGTGAITAGRVIFIHRDRAEDAELLAHELVHVCQWEEEGIAFLWEYSNEYVQNVLESGDLEQSYIEISFEEEARLGEIDCDLSRYVQLEE